MGRHAMARYAMGRYAMAPRAGTARDGAARDGDARWLVRVRGKIERELLRQRETDVAYVCVERGEFSRPRLAAARSKDSARNQPTSSRPERH
jgi:hypothetical protein